MRKCLLTTFAPFRFGDGSVDQNGLCVSDITNNLFASSCYKPTKRRLATRSDGADRAAPVCRLICGRIAMRRQLNIECGCLYKQPAITRWISGVKAVIIFGVFLRSLRTHFCPASYIIKVKRSAKNCRYTRARLRGQLFHKPF